MAVVYHCLAIVLFVNRYVAGVFLRVVRGESWDEVDESLEPTVTVIVPMYNEGAAITQALESLLLLRYPKRKLEIICIDDGSHDDSVEHADAVATKSRGMIRVVRNERNLGKRMSILNATREAKGEIVITIDSDVSIDPDAVRQLVRRFTDERIAAVGGWVDVRNKHASWLARMQVVKYWYSYFLIKNIEWGFRRIMCLSGCLTAYRKSVLLAIEPVLEKRTLWGLPIQYGEDRYLTRQIIKAGYLTTMTLEAKCKTSVPVTLSQYFSQQLRWQRSSIIDYSAGLSHIWKLNPLLAIHYTTTFAILVVYPIGVYRAIFTLQLLPALVLHLKASLAFGIYYRWRVRKRPAEERVGMLSILPMAIIMPLSYAILTPLAMFSLDSSSWETRKVNRRTRDLSQARSRGRENGPPTSRRSA